MVMNDKTDKPSKELPLVIDFLVHVADAPDINPHGVVDSLRVRQTNPWIDLLMARRVGDPWLVRIGDRDARAPHIRVPTPEEEAREARGGMAAPCTRAGLVYNERLRAHVHVKQVIRHVDGLFLVIDNWRKFLPVVSREPVPWFVGWREREFRADELLVSENWAVGGLDQALVQQVKALFALPPVVREKQTGHPQEPTNAERWLAEHPVQAEPPAKQVKLVPVVVPQAKPKNEKKAAPTGGQGSLW